MCCLKNVDTSSGCWKIAKLIHVAHSSVIVVYSCILDKNISDGRQTWMSVRFTRKNGLKTSRDKIEFLEFGF